MNLIVKIILCVFIFINQVTFASDYPQSSLEREMDEMGSVVGGEGLVFRPNKQKSTATRAKIGNVNKYLFDAAIEVLKFAPLASADSKSGTIITDWYNPQGQKNAQHKVIVYIKDDVITPEGLEVVAFERKKVKNEWSENNKSEAVSSVLEEKIIIKARNLYLQSSR